MVLKKKNNTNKNKLKILLILIIVTFFLFCFLLLYRLNGIDKNTEETSENNQISVNNEKLQVSMTPPANEISIPPKKQDDDINVSTMLKYNKINSWDDISKVFKVYDSGKMTKQEGKDFIDIFVSYLNKNPMTTSEDIMELTPFMKVFNVSTYRIIEFSENPDYYGTSGSNSYQILVNDEAAQLIAFSNANNIDDYTYRIESCYLVDNNIIVFGYNYVVTNISGIFVAKINLDNYITENAIGNIDSEDFYYYYDDLSLYYKGEYLYFSNIDKTSFILSLLNSDNDSKFIFNYNNGYYELKK